MTEGGVPGRASEAPLASLSMTGKRMLSMTRKGEARRDGKPAAGMAKKASPGMPTELEGAGLLPAFD